MPQTVELKAAIARAGIRRGDLVHVHSSLFAMGRLDDSRRDELPARVCDVWLDVIGESGTLTVPAAFDDYARFGTPYDCRRSPVDHGQGALSQFVGARSDAVRTFCPLSAVAGIGRDAAAICHQRVGSAFGTGSAWEELYQRDAKMCFLGVRPSAALTFVLLIQFRFGVPYLYNKIYTTPIYEGGFPVDIPVTCTVRYLDPEYQIREDCQQFEQLLFEEKVLKQERVGRANLYVIDSTRAVFDIGTRCLRDNLYYFLAAPPRFKLGRVPMDGSTGAFVPDAIRFADGSPP